MKLIKQIVRYIPWIIISMVLGISYIRFVLIPFDIPKEGIWYVLYMFYNMGIFYAGSILGILIALLYILTDVFYLKEKLRDHKWSIGIRFGFLLIVTLVVIGVHYILEKVIDVI